MPFMGIISLARFERRNWHFTAILLAPFHRRLQIKKDNFEKLEEIIRGNFNLTNEEIFQRLGVSKATFYAVYATKARELKRIYKSQSLF